NFEAVVALRGRSAQQALRDLGLGQLWEAPILARKDLEQIAARSRMMDPNSEKVGVAAVAGLWKKGWVESRPGKGAQQVTSIARCDGADKKAIPIGAIQFNDGLLRFPSPLAGAFTVTFAGKADPTIVIASSASALAPSLASNAAGRLIDE